MKVSPSLLAVAGILLAACASATAASVVPFTETFSSNNSNWTQNPTTTTPADWVSSGGVGGTGGYITTVYTVPAANSGTPVVARATGSNGASGGAFIGDYSNITTVSFYVKSDATFDLPIGLRLGGTGTGMVIDGGFLAAGSGWTLFTFDLSPTNPNIISYEGTLFGVPGATDAQRFAAVTSSVTNLQVFLYLAKPGYTAPGTPTSMTLSVDSVSVVPEPSTSLLLIAGVGIVLLLKKRRTAIS